MTNELTVKPELTDEQIKLVKDTITKNASADELKLFLYRCKVMDLDPLKPGTIHFVKYGNGPGTIVVGIEGFRVIAHRSGKLAGIKRGAMKDDKGHLIGAWAEVYRSDWKEPAREEVPLREYDTQKGPWAKMPETMIKKVAEVAALRMAFPNDLGGIYSPEEMDQAGAPPVSAEQPPRDGSDGVTPGGYRIPFGKYKARKIEEIDPAELASYINYIENKAEKDGKEISGQVAEFIDIAADHLGSLENDRPAFDEEPDVK